MTWFLVVFTLTAGGWSWQQHAYPSETECRAVLEWYLHESAKQVSLYRRNGIAAACTLRPRL